MPSGPLAAEMVSGSFVAGIIPHLVINDGVHRAEKIVLRKIPPFGCNRISLLGMFVCSLGLLASYTISNVNALTAFAYDL